MISNLIMGRFEEVCALHHAIHALKFRTNTKDPTVAMVVQVSTAILEAQMYDILNCGIASLYHSNDNKISPMAKFYMDMIEKEKDPKQEENDSTIKG